jgi:hypothetical protein
LGVQLNAKKAIDSQLPVKEINAFYIDNDPMINKSIGQYLEKKQDTTITELTTTEETKEECVKITVVKLKSYENAQPMQNHCYQNINLLDNREIKNNVNSQIKKSNKENNHHQEKVQLLMASLQTTLLERGLQSELRKSQGEAFTDRSNM